MPDNPYSPPEHEDEDSQPHLHPQAWLKQLRLLIVVMLIGIAGLLIGIVLMLIG